jgi:FOG: CheY-like receiver
MPSFKGRHVLLAEDVEMNREIVLSLLEPMALTIHCAENGTQVFQMFSEEPDLYDLIFMDIHMPEMDGYQATAAIRALDCPQAKTVPIVAMTANVFKSDVEKCMAAGMNSHVGKPIELSDLIAVIKKHLGSA